MDILIREIVEKDNVELASVIKSVLIEQGNAIDGTVFTDEATNRMSFGYQNKKSIYYVVYQNNELLGGCGIAQLLGENESICELQRMFLLKKARGRGIGKQLMELCVNFAKDNNYKTIYLETFPNMEEAIKLYKKSGFQEIDCRMGNTGHFSCNVWMILNLEKD